MSQKLLRKSFKVGQNVTVTFTDPTPGVVEKVLYKGSMFIIRFLDNDERLAIPASKVIAAAG